MNQLLLDITWDNDKARSNLAKHGVTFAQAATLILDANNARIRLISAREAMRSERQQYQNEAR